MWVFEVSRRVTTREGRIKWMIDQDGNIRIERIESG